MKVEATGYQALNEMAKWSRMGPLPEEQKPVSFIEITSAILGIIGISLHWIVLFRWGLLLFIIPLVLSILALVFGFMSVHSLFRKNHVYNNGEENIGLTGISLGILTLMFTVSWLILAQTYLWGWKL